MRMSYHLKLEQTQKLVMTPELQQAITLLQYSALELQTYVQNQLLENPVLEIDESEDTEKRPMSLWKSLCRKKTPLTGRSI